jgi:hypothetical protein
MKRLDRFYCQNNQFISINMKNGYLPRYLNFSGNINLQYVCIDDDKITQVENLIKQYLYKNCQVNSYCTFAPGGTF